MFFFYFLLIISLHALFKGPHRRSTQIFVVFISTGAYLGGVLALLQGFETTLPTQTVPLCTTLRNPFLVTHPKTFLKAPSAPLYTNFEMRADAKKCNFWSKISKKCLKTPFLTCFFFENFARMANYLAKLGTF